MALNSVCSMLYLWIYIYTYKWKETKFNEIISFVLSCSVVSDSGIPWTVAPRLLCPWGFSRQEYWSGLPCPLPGDLPDPGIKPRSPTFKQILYHLSHQGWYLKLFLKYFLRPINGCRVVRKRAPGASWKLNDHHCQFTFALQWPLYLGPED